MRFLPPLNAIIFFALPLVLPTTAMPTWSSSELPLPLDTLLHKLISHPRPLLVPLPESDLPPPAPAQLIDPTIDKQFMAAHDDPDLENNPGPSKGIRLLEPVRFVPPSSSAPTGAEADVDPTEDTTLPITDPAQALEPGPMHGVSNGAAVAPTEEPVFIHYAMPLPPMPASAPRAPDDIAQPASAATAIDMSTASGCLHATLSALRANSTYLVPTSALQWWVFGISFWLTLCVVMGRWLSKRRERRRGQALRLRRRGGGWRCAAPGEAVARRKMLMAGQGVWIEVGDGSGRMERVCLGGDVFVGVDVGHGGGGEVGNVTEGKEGMLV